ncbi:hypothetical protein NLU13_9005 [Sarocladium strictum]|uniref:Conserved oligomeric Golgi complex subunit 8 n=1 Tax=Sarocladium strictum TaxID=5046 RepID=A0AA39G9P5_SARSR|nr:hypothetical protein NLU13_9005 [Sarocladium strictum]
MAEALRDLLGLEGPADPVSTAYLTHLVEQPVEALLTSEPQQLSQASHSLLLSIQGLSKKSHKPIVESAKSHGSLRNTLPTLSRSASELTDGVARLDNEAEKFSLTFSKANEGKLLLRRKRALRLLQNSERLVEVMELPPLLSSAVNTTPPNYSMTLDLYAHIRRLASIYPDSALVASILKDADAAIRQMAGDLIVALKAPNLKLAPALRTVGWLKRLAPDLVTGVPTADALSVLFLVCRVATFMKLLDALEPLRELADNERSRQDKVGTAWSSGQQTERYLKRFIEIFREHSFSIASVFKSISASFPEHEKLDDPLLPIPRPLATLPLYLVDLLLETLQMYLPTIKDQAARESILTQVLYCSGSLARLGADFGLLLSHVGVDEWADLVKRHRLLAGRLESVIGDYRGAQTVASK